MATQGERQGSQYRTQQITHSQIITLTRTPVQLKCTCKYSGNYSAPGPSASGISKRPAQTAGPSSSRPVKKIKSSDEEKLENHALLLRMTMVESRKDLISDEWFRELQNFCSRTPVGYAWNAESPV